MNALTVFSTPLIWAEVSEESCAMAAVVVNNKDKRMSFTTRDDMGAPCDWKISTRRFLKEPEFSVETYLAASCFSFAEFVVGDVASCVSTGHVFVESRSTENWRLVSCLQQSARFRDETGRLRQKSVCG